jgi:hypothetical protein
LEPRAVPKSPGVSRIKSAVNLRKTDGSVSNKWLLQCSKVPILIFNGIPTGGHSAVEPADLRATLDKLHGLHGRDQPLNGIPDGLNARLVRAREIGPERSLPAVVSGIYDKLDNVRRLYGRMYGYDMSIEEILDVIILQTARLSRLVELQSQTMVSGTELEEIEFLRRCPDDTSTNWRPKKRGNAQLWASTKGRW